MLVLSRKLNEEIVIAGDIRVRVLEFRGGRVRLGISAPPEVTVDRAEVIPRNCFDDDAIAMGGERDRRRRVVLRAG